jgi:hypothetical protein
MPVAAPVAIGMIVPSVAVRAFFARIRVNNFIAVSKIASRSALDTSAILLVNTRSVRNSETAITRCSPSRCFAHTVA